MTKQRLKQYKAIKDERDQLLQILMEVEAALYYPKVQQLSGMPGGGQAKEGNPQEDLALHHIELQARYKELIAKLAAEQLAIEAAIETLPPVTRTALRHHYIEGKTWEETAVIMAYSWRQIHRIHALGLQQLEDKEGEGHEGDFS